MKRLLAGLLVLCMMSLLTAAAADDDIVTIEEILALREEIAVKEAELAEKEARYAAQNANRILAFPQDEYYIVLDDRAKIVPEVIRVTEDAPKRTTLVWSTSDRGVAAVDKETGLVQAVRLGTATITCRAADDDKVQRSVTVHVIRPVRNIEVSKRNIHLTISNQGDKVVAGTYQITLDITPANAYDKSVTWSSDDETVATVDQNGLVTAVGHGETLIVVKANDGSNVRGSSRVYVEQGVETMSITEPAVTVYEGERHKLSVEVGPRSAENKEVVWSSSDESIATVNSKGNVTGVNTGVCTITATAADGSGVTASCTVTVNAYVSKITPQAAKVYMKQQETFVFSVSVEPADATDKRVSYASDNPAVAVVNADGCITAVGAGSCTITVKAMDGSGKKTSFTVYVEPLVPLVLEGVDMSHDLVGTPRITPLVANRSFAADITSFTICVRCRNAYGEVIIPDGAENAVQRYTWSQGVLEPGMNLGEGSWAAPMTGYEMVYSAEVWVEEIRMAEGTVYTFAEEDAQIFTWTKY